MKPTLLILIAIFALSVSALDGSAVKIAQEASKLVITVDGKPFSEYYFKDENGAPIQRPFFSPILAADGTAITVDQTHFNPKEHPHHRSVWIAHGDLLYKGSEKGADHWSLKEGGPRENHTGFTNVSANGFVETLDWEDNGHKPIMKETRTIALGTAPDGSRILDTKSEFTALTDLTFGATKESGLIAVRVVKALSKDANLSESTGAKGMKDCWGKKAKWADISGEIDGKPYGVAIFDHPSNPRYPSNWHIRDYGLMSANIFGLHDFDKTVPKDQAELKLDSGKTLVFQYRVVFHPSSAKDAKLDEKWDEFAK